MEFLVDHLVYILFTGGIGVVVGWLTFPYLAKANEVLVKLIRRN
jgi:hypothetical protein